VGTLANGLTYYVRANGRPENRAELRLVVNVGSVVEDADQRGLAHFVEHMAFNGTENFARQDLVAYLESVGMRFGADINAYTSFDETVYMLEVPTDDEEIFATAFQILEDWAHGVSFDGEEIDKERGVVVEEWRLGRGARGRIGDLQLPVMFHGSRYAERKVIGDREVLETAPHEALRRFYRDWYRPDLMAVVAVGSFDESDVMRRIEEHFGDLQAPSVVRRRTEYGIPDHAPTLTSIVTDPEATSIDVTVAYKRPAEETRTIGELRQAIVDGIYDGMLIARLGELARLPEPPYRYAYAGSSSLGRTKSIYQLYAGVADGGVLRGLRTLLLEARRVEQHGFTAGELERAKVGILRRLERAYEERDKRRSGPFAGAYVEHFLSGEPEPSLETVRELYEELIPGITLAEVDARAQQWITDENRIILVSGPDTAEAAIPAEAEVLAVFEEVDTLAVTPWVDRTRDEPLVALEPTPGRIVSEEQISAVRATRWVLSNGVTLVLKPTDFQNDEVLLAGYSPGGHSLVDEADYVTATQAARIVGQMGLGSFDSVELGKKLSGKVAGVRAFIGEISEGVSAAASPRDLETMFQLLYLRFTGARRDEEAFRSYLAATKAALQNQEASPRFAFSKEWSRVTYGDHPRRQLFTLDTLGSLDLDRALDIYRERFADASDFTFTMVGNFELEALRPLVETWVASLPATYRAEAWRDVDAYAKPEVSQFEVHRGIEPQSSVRVVFHGFTEWSPLEDHIASSMAEALRLELRAILREDLGGVYGVNVFSSISRFPRGRYNSGFSFSCDPERTEELLATTFAEIERLKSEGPAAETVVKVREAQRRSRETALKENRFWLSALHSHQINGLPLADILDFESRVEAVTEQSIRAAARRYFDRQRYVQGVLYPEQPK
ncbi:MAG: insulinase family protein, partial [Acidobacteria bacterium]|nr:insulinase family protein [Acidobacteriota bacterium]